MSERINSFRDLKVYAEACALDLAVFKRTQTFPKEELYSLTDQMRRSSRSIGANLAEAWRKRRYRAAFVAKLSDCESEAAETQVWIEFAVKCGYVEREIARKLYREYDQIIGKLVNMIHNASAWVVGK